MSNETLAELAVLAPVLGLLASALFVLLLDLVRPDRTGRASGALALLGLAGSAVAAWRLWPTAGTVLGRGGAGGPATLVLDGLGMFVTWIVLLAAAATAAVSLGYTQRWRIRHAEHYVLLLVASAGMMTLALVNELVVLFLVLETFSLALYVLCGAAQGHRPGLEAAVKYFVLGSVAAAFVLYGAALVYAATGETHLDGIATQLAGAGAGMPALALAGFGLLLVGLGYKAALVPFHQWAPDVYEGAPTPITGLMAAATKAAAFAALARVLWTGFGALTDRWLVALAVLAVASMLLGNLTALVQSDVKRMLGYGAVAQAGYLLAALLAGVPQGVSAALLYLLAYALMNLGAIAVLVGLGQTRDGRDHTRLEDLRGLGGRHPGMALGLAVFLLAMIGLPPTLGFVGKWYIFEALVAAGLTPLAVAVVLNSVLSAFYYARPVFYAYIGQSADRGGVTVPTGVAVVIATTAMVVGLGVLFGGPLAEWARSSGALGPAAAAAEPESGQGLFFTAPTFEKGAR